MNEATLPPCPNWYLSNVLACAKDGTIAWGSNNVIVIAKPKKNSKILKYSLIDNAHKNKIISLVFSPEFGETNKNLLASSGNEHIVKIWNLDDMSIALTYSYSNPEQNVVAIDWSSKDPNLVCCINSEGLLASWNVSFYTCQLITLKKLSATCLSCCPHDANLVAIGSKTGLVYIVDIRAAGTTLYKLRGHNAEVVSLSWCPVDTNVFNNENGRDLLLATSEKDKSIFIWRAGSDGRIQTELTLPSKPLDSHQHRSKLNAAAKWTVVRWVEPKLLLASSCWGELIAWHFPTTEKQKPSWKLVHGCHQRGLFTIAHVPNDSSLENWRTKSKTTVWTLAQDRWVVCCSILENYVEIEYNIPTQGGWIYCIAACPLDTSRIAFGGGDAMLRLWNLSEPHETSFDVTVLWENIKAKVTAIAWHPEKENQLACGTGEGRIGVFDPNKASKRPILYKQYHRSTIYTLQWGPHPEKKEYVLYSCDGAELVFYDPDHLDKGATSVIGKDCTEISWKPDFSCLVVGFKNGTIALYDHNLKERRRLNSSLNCMIQILSWHPESTATDLNLSPMRNYLAVGCDAITITVFDLTDLLADLSISEDSKATDNDGTAQGVITLTGHSRKVVCLAWSPHISGQLISGSFDSTVQVWKVETQELIGTYLGHTRIVLCCMWSPLDPDLIISGSADATIHIWRLSENGPKSETAISKAKKGKSKTKQKSEVLEHNLNSAASVVKPEAKVIPINKLQKKSENIHFPKCHSMLLDKSSILNSIKGLIKEKHSEDNGAKDSNESDITASIINPLFSSQEDFLAMIDEEKLEHIEQGRHNVAAELDIWSNNLSAYLEQAVKQKKLNDFLVSLSASLSMSTWKSMCEVYAHQLLLECNASKAVSYLLCIHQTNQALDILTTARMYKEAYALAKLKLDPEDATLRSILQSWAEYEKQHKRFEQAAHCFVKLGEFGSAAECLKNNKDPVELETAAELASMGGDEEFSVSLANQAITEALNNLDYGMARSIIEKYPRIKHREIQVKAFEELKRTCMESVDSIEIKKWLDGESNYGILQAVTEAFELKTEEYYSEFRRNDFNIAPENEKMLWLHISHQISMAVACDTEKKRMNHIVDALGTSFQFKVLRKKKMENESDFLIQILSKLDKKGPTDEESIYARKDYPVSKSLRAYLCLGLLNWLTAITEESVSESMMPFVQLIQSLLVDALDNETVMYWSTTNEINKLESQLATALVKVQCVEGTEDSQDSAQLVEKLDRLKNKRKQFIIERIDAPSPILAYSKANELISKLPETDVREEFSNTLSRVWSEAVKQTD